jgi:hypothetical protein
MATLSYHQNSILKSNASEYLLADFHGTSESIFYSVQRNADSENLSENAVTDTPHSGYQENTYSRMLLQFTEPAIMMLIGAGLIVLSRLSKMLFKKSYKLTKVYNFGEA